MQSCYVKVQITSDMVGREALLPASADGEKFLKGLGWGEYAHGNLKSGEERNVRQHNLFMACCELVAENTEDENWNTQDKVLEQVKIAARWIECYYWYHNGKTGKMTLNIKTKSIGFDNMDQAEAQGFYTTGFDLLAAKLNALQEDMKAAAVPRAQVKRVCPKCGRMASHRHHKFPQTKENRRKYGKLIDAEFNIEYFCADCHSSHAKLGDGDTWDELEFLIAAIKAHHRPDDYVEPAEWEMTVRDLESKGLMILPLLE